MLGVKTDVENLIKAPSGAVINNNITAHKSYLLRRNALQQKDNTIQELKTKVDMLSNKILSFEKLLTDLMESQSKCLNQK